MITDKGTYDAIGLSDGGLARQRQYIKSVHSMLQPGGLLIITSCNNTLQELIEAFASDEHPSGGTEERRNGSRDGPAEGSHADSQALEASAASNHPGPAPDTLPSSNGNLELSKTAASEAQPGAKSSLGCPVPWMYVDHVRTYKVYSFGGFEGSRVCTVAFKAA